MAEERTLGGVRISALPRFPVTDSIFGVASSCGGDHICLVFFNGGRRVASFASDGPGRTSYIHEDQPFDTVYNLSLEEAIQRTKKICVSSM